MIKTWVKQMRANRTFAEHFRLEHQFHGIVSNYIDETFVIMPTSPLGEQTLLDGVQFSNHSMHLQAKIRTHPDCIRISFHIPDPQISETVIRELKRALVKQLLVFEKRFYSNPIVQYTEKFCIQCIHYKTRPFNKCIENCHFEPKKKGNN